MYFFKTFSTFYEVPPNKNINEPLEHIYADVLPGGPGDVIFFQIFSSRLIM